LVELDDNIIDDLPAIEAPAEDEEEDVEENKDDNKNSYKSLR
jgi:hypothetical protein